VATPTRLSGLGSPDVVPRLNDAWDPSSVQLTPEDYFVLTRVDGRSTLKDIWTVTGFPEDKAAAILHKLREAGALLLPGDQPKPPPGVPEQVTDSGSASFNFNPETYTGPVGKRLKTAPPVLPDEALLAEEVELSEAQKRAILVKYDCVIRRDLLRILDVDASADKKDLKRAYFKLSKDFHPDRFYGKNLGSFREKLAAIFETATQAFDVLNDDVRRARYLGETTAGGEPVSRKAHASELFQSAVQLEVDGDLPGALKLFAAAIRLEPQPRYLRRAAEAAVRAQELRSAEEYAKKAAELDPRDASAHRTLAKVLRALGRSHEARAELETAARLEPSNPHIAAELEEITKLGG